MMLGISGTRDAVREKFCADDTFNSDYFLRLIDIYLRNERMLYDAVHSEMDTKQVAIMGIKYVVMKDAIEQDQVEPLVPSVKGIKAGVGGRLIYDWLISKVMLMVEEMRDEH